ncbi:integrase [Falsirhodobacter sp. alg1]|uniref:tyrosine-type recombinase/integrase n=1 Tax=Falsirhodobacter sp. alg1 TaxID=1472418 RepID=UPI001EDB283F|nr:integrase [Falsirhodobacter sp. alg1]
MTVGQALAIYGEGHAPTTSDPARIGYAIDALDPFWGDLSVSSIKGETCRRYVAYRNRVPGTVRRELGTLQAALNYCMKEGHMTTAPLVSLPEKPNPKERWLTREEMFWLMRASRHLRIDGRHLLRFILVGRYTGTRKSASLALGINRPSVNDGWIDTERGVMYRVGTGTRRTKKRQPSTRLPAAFLAHVRRWAAHGDRWVVQNHAGYRVAEIKKGWANACIIAGELAAAKGRHVDLTDVTPHVLRHTAITWAMQAGAEKWDVAGFFGVSLQTLESVYGHHHPDHQQSAVNAMQRRVSGASPRNKNNRTG